MRILLVEDDVDLSAAVRSALARDGLVVTAALDGVEAVDRISEFDFDVVILDRDLPRMSGDSVCREIRTSGQSVPVLMLTALQTVPDRVAGLELGADDYLTKPFAYAELLARVRALGRRVNTSVAQQIRHGDVAIDLERQTVTFRGERVRLSPKEYGILEALVRADGRPLSVDRLLDIGWDAPHEISRSVVKVTVHALRQKLTPELVVHDAGFGYRLESTS
ncbi:response regulator transcription factor [Ruania rhizosphaerae]|uniref:response regulator transcription factor n=1 Tax=Ruania rhizosphaerae TaxID=1840413 RepID=UPI00135BB3E2|nr:response regulator transcription factor [Ruania rhizosphaerae]